MKKHLHWWKHNLLVTTPLWGFALILLLLGFDPELVGKIVGFAVFNMIITGIVFKLFDKDNLSNNKRRIAYLVSVVIGVVIILIVSPTISWFSILLGMVTLYLIKFVRFQTATNK